MHKLKQRKKIAYVSGTRADFGLISPVLKEIKKSKKLKLQLYLTGMHLMPELGNTYKEVKKEFPEAALIPVTFRGSERLAMAAFAGKFLTELVKVFSKNRPNFVLILGDRVEMLCAATVCLYLGIPSVQLYGGEKTFTADELARHAITKLVSLHFANTQITAERIKKMGEEEWRIHVVGAPALDTILHEKLPDRKAVFKKLNLEPNQNFILVTQHPVTEEWQEAGKQMEEILAAVKTFGLPVVVIYPNADTGGRKIIEVIKKEKNNPLFRIFPNLPFKDFLALEREAAVWVGNSSAIMLESASFKAPAVLVGTRQLGREHGANVLKVGYHRKEIGAAIWKSLFDKKYRQKLKRVKNPWGDGMAAKKIVKILQNLSISPRLFKKQLTYD